MYHATAGAAGLPVLLIGGSHYGGGQVHAGREVGAFRRLRRRLVCGDHYPHDMRKLYRPRGSTLVDRSGR